MKYVISSLLMCCLANVAFSQDSSFTYTKVLKFDSLKKDQIYDKVLLWCSKSFNNSKSAINVKERDGGIVAGKANYISNYKIFWKKDSTDGIYYTNYFFDWTIEIKDSKLRLSATHYLLNELDKEFTVTTNPVPPFPILLQNKEKTALQWKMSKEYLLINMNKLMESLYAEVVGNKGDW